MIAKGDTVMFRGTSSGTQQGEFMGVAPAGKRVAVSGDSMIPQLQPKTSQVNSTNLAYLEQGTGDAVVLVHVGTLAGARRTGSAVVPRPGFCEIA
jgi:hypothetical protein